TRSRSSRSPRSWATPSTPSSKTPPSRRSSRAKTRRNPAYTRPVLVAAHGQERVMEEVTLTAELGRPTGSRPSRRLRHDGKVPAVLYGHGTDPMALSVDSRELRNALTGDAGL